MRNTFFILVISFMVHPLYAQGMFVRKSKIGFDLGSAYIYNNSFGYNTENDYAWNIGVSLINLFDVGASFAKNLNSPGNSGYNKGNSFFVDAYLMKGKTGIVLNTAASKNENGSSLLIGMSFYSGMTPPAPIFFDKIYVTFSAGYILEGNPVFGISIPFEKIISDNFSAVLTPGISFTKTGYLFSAGVDIIVQ